MALAAQAQTNLCGDLFTTVQVNVPDSTVKSLAKIACSVGNII